MVKGDRVRLVRPYVSDGPDRGGWYRRACLHYMGAEGTVVAVDKYHNVNVEWDAPYRGNARSGMRNPSRFEFVGKAPW